MVAAAKAFLGSLNDHQKAKATYEYMDGERVFWYYPPMNRHGLPPPRHGTSPTRISDGGIGQWPYR
ncbi:MAG: hypothetical protein CM1200mP27_03430 [Chloroflexota bacterium]|nr:MAG: hypothetical protein CM1200mP27_03430 [Chloroflexota bacterium]